MLFNSDAHNGMAKKRANGGIPQAYANFDLMIHRAGDKYSARVINSLAGEPSTEFVLPVAVATLQKLFADLDQAAKKDGAACASAKIAMRNLGGRLFEAVFENALRGCLQSSLDEADQTGGGLRLRLHLADAPELAVLPWELLYNSSLNQFLALSVKTPIVRYLNLPAPLRPWEVKPPLRVLVMISSPANYPKLDVEAEWAKLKEAFEDLESRGLAKLERLEEATLAALQKRLQNGEYHIFHFIGHGVFDERSQDGSLILEDEDELGDPVNGERLGILLHDHQPLRLAVLNACDGARGDSRHTFAGLAQSFVQSGLPAVIAMQFPVSDETAVALSHVFYETLAKGHPVDAALAEARKAIFTRVSEIEWSAPVLYMRSPDGRIFNFGQARQTVPPNAALVPAPIVYQPVRPGGRKRRKLLLVVAALVMLLSAFVAYSLIPKKRRVETSPKVIAVLPFTVNGSAEYADLGKGMVDLLSTNLDGADELRSVDPRAIISCTVEKHHASFGPRQGHKIAARLGAGLFVLGNITEVRGRLRISAALYENSNPPQLLVRGQVEGEAEQIFNMVDQLTAQLLADQSFAPSTKMRRIAAVTTDTLPALKAYLSGENALDDGDFERAVASFRRAITIDTAFALAYYRLSIAEWWRGRIALSHAAAEKAVHYADRLSAHERDLLEASLATRRGATAEAEQLYRRILEAYPDDVEALSQLGEVLFHGGPLRGRSIAESRDVWEHVLALQPAHILAYLHLSRLAALEGRRAELDTLTQRVVALKLENEQAFEILALRAFALQDEAQQAQMMEALQQRRAATVLHTVWNVAAYCGDLRNAENIARFLTLPAHPNDVRVVGHVVLAHLALAQGRWKAAQMELAKAEQLDFATGIEYRALLSALPFLPVTETKLAALRAALERLDTAAVPAAAPALDSFSAHHGLHPHLRLYLLGLLNVRFGQSEAVIQYANTLEQLGGPPTVITLAGDLAQSLHAQVARLLEQPADALALLEMNKMESSYELAVDSPFYSQAYERYMRAMLLHELGRFEEALAWYDSFGEISIYDLIYLAPSHLQRGEIYETMGEREQAIQHYTRFIKLWQNCDPELKPMLTNAKARLAQLN
ncbi:CHAT domain-containing protein [candidate division KSB1 bacterium]|nr:CHAT domain-containing protein [candidate division KSB1 bacterium]